MSCCITQASRTIGRKRLHYTILQWCRMRYLDATGLRHMRIHLYQHLTPNIASQCKPWECTNVQLLQVEAATLNWIRGSCISKLTQPSNQLQRPELEQPQLSEPSDLPSQSHDTNLVGESPGRGLACCNSAITISPYLTGFNRKFKSRSLQPQHQKYASIIKNHEINIFKN